MSVKSNCDYDKMFFFNVDADSDREMLWSIFDRTPIKQTSRMQTFLLLYEHKHYFLPVLQYVRMAERSKALRSGRSLVLQALVRIPLLTYISFKISMSNQIAIFTKYCFKILRLMRIQKCCDKY